MCVGARQSGLHSVYIRNVWTVERMGHFEIRHTCNHYVLKKQGKFSFPWYGAFKQSVFVTVSFWMVYLINLYSDWLQFIMIHYECSLGWNTPYNFNMDGSWIAVGWISRYANVLIMGQKWIQNRQFLRFSFYIWNVCTEEFYYTLP